MLATSIRNLPKRAKICNDTPSISIGSVQLSVEQTIHTIVLLLVALCKGSHKAFLPVPKAVGLDFDD